MKKFILLLFTAGLVTAVSAQPGDRNRNDSRDNNRYQSSRSNNDRYDDRNSDWNDRGDHNRYERNRQRAARQRYEMMMRRNQVQYHNQRRYDRYPTYGHPVKPSLQIILGIGGRRH